MKGRDRNKPCICGSGKKYKKCHYLIEWKRKQKEDGMELIEQDNILRGSFDEKH